jgi:hypothetical protein
MKKTKRKNKPGAGRPRKWNADKLAEGLEKYTLEKFNNPKEYPILKEFCFIEGVLYDTLSEISKKNEKLFRAIKRCMMAKEIKVEQLTSRKRIDNSFGIFTLKQMGWSDKQDISLTGPNGGPVQTEMIVKIVKCDKPDAD